MYVQASDWLAITRTQNSVIQPGSTINSLTENIPGVIYKVFYRHTMFRPSLDPSHQPRVTAPPGLAMTLIIQKAAFMLETSLAFCVDTNNPISSKINLFFILSGACS